MVLASNEWLDNTEDEEKPQTVRANNTTTEAATTTTATTASTSTTTSTNSISTVTNTTTQSIVNAAVTTLTTTATTTTSSSNSNNISSSAATVTETSNQLTTRRSTENITKKQGVKNQAKGEKRNHQQQQQQQQQQSTLRNKQTKQINSKNSPPPYDHQENKFSIINVDNILSVMSETTAVESIIINSDTDSDSSEGDNNNLLNTSTASNTTITNDVNTPQSSLMRQSKSVPSIPLLLSSSNVSSKTLSTALRTVLTNVIHAPQYINNNNVNISTYNAINNATNNATNNVFPAPSTFGSAISDTIPTFAGKYNNSSNGNSQQEQQQQQLQVQRSDPQRSVTENNGLAKILLICEASSHPFSPRTIFLTPNVECKVGRLIAKSKASDNNAIFDCKVLSRNHAVLWYSEDGKFWVKDTKSSNGTYINENKLGTEGAELHFGDTVKFGVDVLENSRKEVHGCIIACVKLYLPDGREAISIDLNTHRALYSGEGIITFDELRRLNLYMQEASQRELVLQSKLFNIQNVLDATRKNSALCWQSMVAEDQLLHRIHLLEKKLQIMEKNVPESSLRNEIFKLLDDKSTYQNQAKESLRKVYQERCDAMQLLTKMEAAYVASDNECKILHEQIAQSKETIQDVNNRLISLEKEYHDYKDDVERQLLEANERESKAMEKLIETAQQREFECDHLKQRIEELMSQNATKNRNDDEDDDDDDVDVVDDDIDVLEGEEKRDRTKIVTTLADVDDETIDIVVDDDDDDDDEDDNDDDDYEKDVDECFAFRRKRTLVSKSTSVEMKDLIEAENNGVVADANAVVVEKKEDLELKTNDNDDNDNANGGNTPRMNANEQKQFANIMENIKTNLKQLKNHDETVKKNEDNIDGVDSDEDSDNEDKEEMTETVKANDKSTEDNKKYALMQTVIALLHEAHDKLSNYDGEKSMPLQTAADSTQLTKQESKPLSAVLKGNYKLEPKASDSSFSSENSMDSIIEVHKNQEESSDKDDDIEVLETIFTNTTVNAARPKPFSLLDDIPGSIKEMDSSGKLQQLENEIIDYKNEIFQLNDKLELLNKNAKQSEELIETEYNTLRNEIVELTELSASLLKEKMSLENTVTELKSQKEMALEEAAAKSPAPPPAATSANVETQTTGEGDKTIETVLVTPSDANSPAIVGVLVQQNTEIVRKYVDTASNTGIYKFEEEMRDDFAAINSNVMQREEELITYKEYLEQLQTDNIYLRNEIADLKVQANSQAIRLLKRFLPYAAVFLAIVVYFLSYHY